MFLLRQQQQQRQLSSNRTSTLDPFSNHAGSSIGFSNIPLAHEICLVDKGPEGEQDPIMATIQIQQTSSSKFTIRLKNSVKDAEFTNVTASFADPPTFKHLQTFIPGRTRLDSTIVRVVPDEDIPTDGTIPSTKLHVFQKGEHHIVELRPPGWLARVLSLQSSSGDYHSLGGEQRNISHSFMNDEQVLSRKRDMGGQESEDRGVTKKRDTVRITSPMPAKILRVEVQKGDEVVSGQAVVVIESMKMETVIRCPPLFTTTTSNGGPRDDEHRGDDKRRWRVGRVSLNQGVRIPIAPLFHCVCGTPYVLCLVASLLLLF